MKPERRRAAVPVGEAIGDALDWHHVTDEVRLQRVVFDWTAIVGARIGARTTPDGLSRVRDGGARVLWIRVANTSWLHELTLLKDQLTATLRAAVGDPPLFDEIRFHLGRAPAEDLLAGVTVRRPEPPRRRRPVPASAERQAEIEAQTSGIADDELRELVRAVRIRNDR
jgi:predicted nucleic acid-binding Zn ribbon protein